MVENQNVISYLDGAAGNAVLEGERLFNEGRIDEARVVFQTAVENCPGDALAWNNLAVLSMAESEAKEAEKYLRRALELRSDFLEARYNLAEVYCQRAEWRKAERELKAVLTIKPSETLAIKRLAGVYMDSGQPDKAKALLDDSDNMGAMKIFIDSLWLGIKYCAMQDELSARDKLEKYTAAVLRFLDGLEGQSRRYKLVGVDPESGEETTLEDFYKSFYYKESPSPLVIRQDSTPDSLKLVLTIGDHEDWHLFREALRAEMRAEGGCLGDFTQSRKILRRENRLAKYDLEATLKYFQDNVGPCDCHALRAVLV